MTGPACTSETTLLDDIAVIDYERPVLPYIQLSKKIYDIRRLKDFRRMAVFVLRAIVKGERMKRHVRFFLTEPLRRHIATAYPCVIEQATRAFFYNGSTFKERTTLIKEHFLFLEKALSPELLTHVYTEKGLLLWQQRYKDDTLSLHLSFDGGQKKEGLLAVVLRIGGKKIYQAIFWLARDKNGQMALWIGALQGSPGQMDTIRDLTKKFFGYRPKNFMIHALRALSQKFNINLIYAVSNHGFYANNHLRLNRKLKTSLDDFWLETGGCQTEDDRFYELPTEEPRKKIEEVDSHKRNLYKKRFAFLDALNETITKTLRSPLR